MSSWNDFLRKMAKAPVPLPINWRTNNQQNKFGINLELAFNFSTIIQTNLKLWTGTEKNPRLYNILSPIIKKKKEKKYRMKCFED